MIAAKVADGIVAIVSNSSSYNYTGIEFAAWNGGSYVGWFSCMNYILLVDPAVYPLEAAGEKAKSMKMGLKGFNDVPIPYAKETKSINKTEKLIKGTSIASGKVSAHGKNIAPVMY